MKNIVLFNMLKKLQNLLVLLVSLAVSYFLVPPFFNPNSFSLDAIAVFRIAVSFLFMLTFSFVMAAFTRNMDLKSMFRSNLIKIVFFIILVILSLIFSLSTPGFLIKSLISAKYFGRLPTPENPNLLFEAYFHIIKVFLILFASIILTALVNLFKERIQLAKKQRGSVFGIIVTTLGIGAIQICTVNSPGCYMVGITIGLMIGSVFPPFISSFIKQYSVFFVLLSILLQILSLYLMGCFKINESSKK